MYKNKKILAIIPARGGSKGLPRKNIKLFFNKPLLAWTIKEAKRSRYIDRTIVSTDDKEIAMIAKQYGAEVPFMRPKYLAVDTTPDQPVFIHALTWLDENEGYTPDIIVDLRATTPLKTSKIIDAVIKEIVDSSANIVRTMSKVPASYHPYWLYTLSKTNTASLYSNIDIGKFYRRQLLPPLYRINGVAAVFTTEVILRGDILRDKKMRGFVINEKYAVDIDIERDFKFCEFLLSRRRG